MSKKGGRDALTRLRRLFTAGSWVQGTMHKRREDKDYYCLVGGLQHVTGVGDFSNSAKSISDYHSALDLLSEAINRGTSRRTNTMTVMGFNDSRGRKVEEVIEVIDKAIEKAGVA